MDKQTLLTRISQHLRGVVEGRSALQQDESAHSSVMALKRFQSTRLRDTYADLRAQPRYCAAVDFFTEDLYSDCDYSRRDADLLRIVPQIARLFPLEALSTVEAALHLHALSEMLDRSMAQTLGYPTDWDDATYRAAWRRVGSAAQRAEQLELVRQTGERLDRLVKLPLIGLSLRAMSGAAALAGLSELHGFLLRGFTAFKAMRGAVDFLRIIAEREQAIMQDLFNEDAPRASTVESKAAQS